MTVNTFDPNAQSVVAEQPSTTHATKVAPEMGNGSQGTGTRIGFISLG